MREARRPCRVGRDGADAGFLLPGIVACAAPANGEAQCHREPPPHGPADPGPQPPPPAPGPAPIYYEPCTPADMEQHFAAQNARLAPWLLQYDTQKPPAHYAATLKMHKTPPSIRFLACSHNCPATAISDLVTAVLRAILPNFIQH